MSNQTFSYDTAQNLTTNSFTRTGYTFTGWNTEANGSGTGYMNEESISNLTTTSGATIPVFAQWTDSEAPLVTLTGSGTITTVRGYPYIDAGATWTDNVDGSGSLTASGTVDTNTL